MAVGSLATPFLWRLHAFVLVGAIARSFLEGERQAVCRFLCVVRASMGMPRTRVVAEIRVCSVLIFLDQT